MSCFLTACIFIFVIHHDDSFIVVPKKPLVFPYVEKGSCEGSTRQNSVFGPTHTEVTFVYVTWDSVVRQFYVVVTKFSHINRSSFVHFK